MCVLHIETRCCQSSTVSKLVCDFAYTTAHHSQLCNHPFKWSEMYKASKVASEIRAFFHFLECSLHMVCGNCLSPSLLVNLLKLNSQSVCAVSLTCECQLSTFSELRTCCWWITTNADSPPVRLTRWLTSQQEQHLRLSLQFGCFPFFPSSPHCSVAHLSSHGASLLQTNNMSPVSALDHTSDSTFGCDSRAPPSSFPPLLGDG